MNNLISLTLHDESPNLKPKYINSLTDLVFLSESNSLSNEHVKDLTNLQTLTVYLNEKLTDEGINHLTKLQRLEIVGTGQLTKKCLSNFSHSLTFLGVYDMNDLKPEDLLVLTNLRHLHCRVNLFSEQKLQTLSYLRTVDIVEDGEEDTTTYEFLNTAFLPPK